MIRPLEQEDYTQWITLWQENCCNQISETVTTETWRRLLDYQELVYGLGAFDANKNLIGILHYVLHATTGSIAPACYMQDLYVAKNHRRQGIAKSLIEKLTILAKNKQWARLYWFADHHNIAAQALYKTLGIQMDFSLHMISTQG